jgi:hypothetical protein
MKDYLERKWAAWVIGLGASGVMLLLKKATAWPYGVRFLLVTMVSIPCRIWLIKWNFRRGLRLAARAAIARNPNTSTFQFEYRGKIYHGRVHRLTGDFL